ncbi:MAG: hypothetical protein IJH11_06965 [Lachnospiraceae bacterium]|nr:hypothetical protein [Lachnospiraceae bacterium]
MSEILRKPRKLLLHGICKIPTGKAGKAAAKQYANERKARKRALARLAEADSKSGVGLLVMLTSADRRLGRYIFKKLDKVIPLYVKALSDETSGMSAEEMSWLMDVCERRGYRTLWLDLAGVEKLDKRAVLHLVAGELIRVLEEPAPERATEEALGEILAEAEVEPETVVVEELIEPEMADAALEMAEVEAETEATVEEELGAPDEEIASETTDVDESTMPDEEAGIETEGAEESTNNLEESIERVDARIDTEEPVENTDVEIIQEESCEKAETVQEEPSLSAEKEAGDIVEAYAVQAEPETEEKTENMNEAAESPVAVEEILTTEEEPTVTEEKPAAKKEPVPEEKPAPRKRTRKTSTKAEGEKAPAKPRRKRAPAAPLTVEATLAKRRRQMGLE